MNISLGEFRFFVIFSLFELLELSLFDMEFFINLYTDFLYFSISSYISYNSIFGVINLHDIVIFLAVGKLSPVSTQILIPAVCKSLIVSGTFSCKLSSTAVQPIKVNPCSIFNNNSS